MYVRAVYCTPNMELIMLQYRLTGKRMHICSTTSYTEMTCILVLHVAIVLSMYLSLFYSDVNVFDVICHCFFLVFVYLSL